MTAAQAGFAGFTADAARRAGFVVLALYALVYVVPLGVRPLASPDEARYAEISREMIAADDWVSPRLNGVRYFEKPILGYWLNSVSLEVFGENAFALRLPTALAAGLTALLVFLLAARFATRASACLAAAIYLTTLLVFGVGTFGVLDTILTLFLTGALASFYAAYAAPPGGRRLGWLAACGACCAGAFLSKGFLALAIPAIVAGPFLVLRRDGSNLLRMPWVPIGVAAALAAPWAILVSLREPDFWRYFFWVEHVQRFLGANAQHAEPFWYFIVRAPLAALPWSVLWPAAAIGLHRRMPAGPFPGYLVLWIVMPLLFFSVSKGKLLTYILPCFAPLAILTAIGLEHYLGARLGRAYSLGAAALGVLVASILVALVAAQRGAFDAMLFAAGEWPRWLGLLACLGLVLGAAVVAALARAPVVRLAAIAAAGVALVLPIQLALLPQQLIDGRAPAGFLAEAVRVTPETLLVADPSLFGAVAWSFRRDDVYVLGKGEIAYGLGYPESRHRSLDDTRLGELVAEHAGDVVLIVRDSTAAALPGGLLAAAERRQRSDIVILRL